MGTRNEELQRNKNIADALVKQDLIMDKLDGVASGLENVLKQLQATHEGHEEELWGKEFEVEEEE